jgi:hypothetical protein
MKKIVLFSLLMVFTVPCIAVSSAKGQEAKIAYYPSSTVLRGELRKEHRLGPPGFGETPKEDAKVTIIVLVLKKPVTAVPSPDKDAKDTSNLNVVSGVSEIQLFFEGDEGPALKALAEKLIGKTVNVTGTVNEAIAAMDFTKLTMTASKIDVK